MAKQGQSRQQSSYMPSQGSQQGGGAEAPRQASDVQIQGGGRQAGRAGGEHPLARRPGSYLGNDFRASPFALMRRLSDDMDRIFENFGMGGMFARGLPFAGGGAIGEGPAFWSPDIEMYEEQGKLVVEAELPGMRREDIQVQLEADALVVSGERRHESQSDRAGRYLSERSYGTFHRMIRLPEGADAEAASATFRDGILRVEMPFQERTRGRRLEIGDGDASRQGALTQGASNSAQPNARGDDGAPTG